MTLAGRRRDVVVTILAFVVGLDVAIMVHLGLGVDGAALVAVASAATFLVADRLGRWTRPRPEPSLVPDPDPFAAFIDDLHGERDTSADDR